MKQLFLTQNKFCLVDDTDFERVQKYKWHLHIEKKSGLYYARTNIAGQKIYLGRYLLKLFNDYFMTCDHKNGQTLDYRRCNLRKISMADNLKAMHFRQRRKINIPTLDEILNLDNFDIPFYV